MGEDEAPRAGDEALDAAHFSELSAALSACGLDQEASGQALEILAGLLHLGAASFVA